MKWNFKSTLVMFFVLFSNIPLMAYGREYFPENAFVFSFKENFATLRHFETSNNVELDFMKLAIYPKLESIRDGQDHLRIVSYLGRGEARDTASLCEAFRQASLVRLYLSAKYEISKSSYTFYVDTTARKSDLVSVELINHPIRMGEDNSLYYTLNDSPVFYKTVMEMYDRIPYLREEESFSEEYFVDNIMKQYSTLLRDAVNKQASPETGSDQLPDPMNIYLFEGGSGVLKDGEYVSRDREHEGSEYVVSFYNTRAVQTASTETVHFPRVMQKSISVPVTMCDQEPVSRLAPVTVSVILPGHTTVSSGRSIYNSKSKPRKVAIPRTWLQKMPLRE